MTIRRAHPLLAALLLGAVLIPVPLPAFNGPGCGGEWPPPRNAPYANPCYLSVAGAPLTVFGNATHPTNPNANVAVRAWVAPSGYPEVVLLECSAQGKGSVTCSDGIPDESCASPFPEEACRLLLPQQYRLLQLECHVEGTPAGQWFCQTGIF